MAEPADTADATAEQAPATAAPLTANVLVPLAGKKATTTTVEVVKEPGASLGINVINSFFTSEVVVEDAPSTLPLCRGDVILFVNGFEALDAQQTAELIRESSNLRLTLKTSARGALAERFGTDVATAVASGATARPQKFALACCLLLFIGLAWANRHVAAAEAAEAAKLRSEQTHLKSKLRLEEMNGVKSRNKAAEERQEAAEAAMSHRQEAAALERSVKERTSSLDETLERIRSMEAANATLQRQQASLMAEAAKLREELEAERGRAKSTKLELEEQRAMLGQQKRTSDASLAQV